MAPYVGAPEIKARRLVLTVEYHGQIGNPGCYFLKLVAVANRLGIAMKPFLWAAGCLIWLAPTAACPRWLAKLALKMIKELVRRSRAEAAALEWRDVASPLPRARSW